MGKNFKKMNEDACLCACVKAWRDESSRVLNYAQRARLGYISIYVSAENCERRFGQMNILRGKKIEGKNLFQL